MYSEAEKEEAKRCPIDAILRYAGRSTRSSKTHNNIVFFSPFREEKNPSFVWDTVLNRWKDFGDPTGKLSGDSINLVEYLYDVKYVEALHIIAQIQGSRIQSISEPLVEEKVSSGLHSNTEVISVGPITDNRCRQYLESRKIPEKVYSDFLKEIHYQVGREYVAISIPTDNGGYAVRGLPDALSMRYAKGIKRFIGSSGISTFRYVPGSICPECLVFEGQLNMASYVAMYGIPTMDMVVLNTVGNAKFLKGVNAYGVRKLFCYLDNDDDGRKATSSLREISGCQVLDCSNIYARYGYNDLNELLMKKE